MPKVFISHSTKDRAFAEREIISLLESKSIDTWYARDDIQTASEWERAIVGGLEACDWFLVIMSPRSAASKWVKAEVGWAMDYRPGRIIPVMMEACSPYLFHLMMPTIQHVDFRADPAEARQRLLKVLVTEINNPLDLQAEMERQSAELHPLYQKALELKRSVGLVGSGVGPSAADSLREGDRLQVGALGEQWRLVPPTVQQKCPALLNSLAQLQLAGGQPATALDSFRAAAGLVSVPRAKAEVMHNAYHAALAARNYSDALAALEQAAAGDPERWAPFPLAKYQPRQILGVGGFGVLFLCRHRHLGASVVVKAMTREERKPGGEVFSEASLLEGLEHPALVRARDGDFADAASERPFLVLDHFDAPNLHAHVEEHGPLSPADLLAVACPVAEALHVAHRQNILHRDVKPANILVRRDEAGWRVKLIDFGLAQQVRGKGEPAAGVAGTVDYAAPEQMGRQPGEKVGTPADVYGFARTCCYALFKTPHPLRRHWQQVPEELSELLDRCLAEGPADRPQDFGEILPHLYRLRDEVGAAPLNPLQTLQQIAQDAFESMQKDRKVRADIEALASATAEEARAVATEAVAALPESLDSSDLQRLIDQYLAQVPAATRSASRVSAALSVRESQEKAMARQLLERFRSLPEGQRQQLPDLLNAVARLQVTTGDFEAAQKSFEEVAGLVSGSPESQAEVHANLFQVALERGDLDLAFREYQEACRLDPGQHALFPLDVFEAQRILGKTATGLNFLCRHRKQDRLVVVKAVTPTLMGEDLTRLFAALRVVAPLKHPALLRVLAAGWAVPSRKKRPFVVHEVFPGASLWEHVPRQGLLPIPDFLAVARLAAQGLQACHAAGVVHGHVNPEAILVANQPPAWVVKVADVGFPPPRFAPGLTRRTAMLATLAGLAPLEGIDYTAPEVLRGGTEPTPAADVFAFGRTCCFTLFGTPIPRSRDWSRLSEPLAELLEQCLEDEPRERPADFNEVELRLTACPGWPGRG